jgi:hypothetical protein
MTFSVYFEIVDRDIGSFLCKSNRRRTPDAGCAARDKCDFSFQL